MNDWLKGNQYWKLRKTFGEKAIFKTPEEVWERCLKYFEWVEKNPITEQKLFMYQGDIIEHDLKRPRPMTIIGLAGFLEIDPQTWKNYLAKPEFYDVCHAVENIITTHKFDGAAAGIFNPLIIARDIGLKEGVDHSSTDGTMSPPTSIKVVPATDEDRPTE